MSDSDALIAPMAGAVHAQFAGVETDTVAVGDARIKRLVYPVGMRWSTDIKPLVGGDHCTHAHVGFLARGRLHGEYADGCTFDYTAPAAVGIQPGHDAWVVGEEPAVLIQIDFERDTMGRLGVAEHRHT